MRSVINTKNLPDKLTAGEAKVIADMVIDSLGTQLKSLLARSDVSPADLILFMPVGKKFTGAREVRGLAIKEVSARIRVPQYRLRAVENARLRQLKSDAATKYAEFLKLTTWYQDWCSENEAFVAKYGLALDET